MLIINDRSFHWGSLQIDTTNHNRIQYWLHFILILQQSMWTILMITWYRAQGTQSVLTLLCEHLAKSSSNLNLIFKTFSHPACYHHHTGQGLWGREASVISLVWPYVLHCSRCPTVSVSRRRVSRSSGASTQPAASPRTAHPADTTTQHRDVHNHTFTPPALLSGISTPATPSLLNLLLLPPSQHWSPSPPLIKVYQRESTEADNWNFVKYPLAPWCRCTAAIETVLWSG